MDFNGFYGFGGFMVSVELMDLVVFHGFSGFT